MQIYDCHLHVSQEAAPNVFLGELMPNVDGLILSSVDYEDSCKNISYALAFDKVKTFVGIHPLKLQSFNIDAFTTLLAHPKVLGIGECGLDKRLNLDQQIPLLKAQIELTLCTDKALCFHIVRAHDVFLSLLKFYNRQIKGYIHDACLSPELYTRYRHYGLKFSLTKKVLNSKKAHAMISTGNPESFLIESDYDGSAPYDLKNLYAVQNLINTLKGQDCATILNANAQQLFQGEWN